MRRAFLEVVKGRFAAGLPARVELVGRQLLGTGPDAVLRIEDARALGKHAAIVQRSDEWELEDLSGRRRGTKVNGTRVDTVKLRSGDEIALGVTRLRVLIEDVATSRNPKLEQAVAQDPRDDGALSVYADWLLETGDPLGERIGHGREGDAADLGRLALHLKSGAVAVEWYHGLVHRASLSNAEHFDGPKLQDVLEALLCVSAARFIVSLEIDVASFSRGGKDPVGALRVSLREIQELIGDANLPALRELRLGPLLVAALPPKARTIVAPRQAPRLPESRPSGYLVLYEEAWLEVDRAPPRLASFGVSPGARLPLDWKRRNFVFGPREDEGIVLDLGVVDLSEDDDALSDEELAQWEDGDMVAMFEWSPGWAAGAATAVNGRAVEPWCQVRPGDVIDFGGLRVRLCARTS